MLRWHLGPGLTKASGEAPYVAFDRNFQTLSSEAGVTCSILDLDRYLWLAGFFRRWVRDREAPINPEAASLFTGDDAAGRPLGGRILLPAGQ